MKYLILFFTLIACSKAQEQSSPLDPGHSELEELKAISQRVQDHIDDHGYAIVWGPDHVAKHQGDALWRSGLALAALPCGSGSKLIASMTSMVDTLGGGFWRHPTIPDDISMDSALSVYLAAAARISHCPGETGLWHDLMAKHLAFMDANSDRLNPSSSATIPAEFDFVRDQLAHKLGLAGEPHSDRQNLLETEIWVWALAVRHSPSEVKEIVHREVPTYEVKPLALQGKASCFRVNLGWMAFRSIEHTGRRISASGRDRFCAATDGLDLPLVDNWCGRDGLRDFLTNWQPNVWDFRPQRCPAWEEPDCIGDSCAGIDKLHALTELYKLL